MERLTTGLMDHKAKTSIMHSDPVQTIFDGQKKTDKSLNETIDSHLYAQNDINAKIQAMEEQR